MIQREAESRDAINKLLANRRPPEHADRTFDAVG
jgi:hypothetical protein